MSYLKINHRQGVILADDRIPKKAYEFHAE